MIGRSLTAALGGLLLAGCAGTGMYDTAGYEECVCELTLTPDSIDIEGQVVMLEELVNRVQANGHRVAPGIHAHLGYLYALRGDMDGAIAAFLTEKETYPESTVFVDGVLDRLGYEQEG